MTKKTLMVVSVTVAGLAMTTATARADDAKGSATAASEPGRAEAAKKPTPRAAKDAKAKEEKAKEAKEKKAKAKEEEQGKVVQVTEASDEAATKANADVVGTKAQRANERKAEAPRPKPDENKQAHDAANAIGRATTTAADWVAVGVEDTAHATDKPGKYDPFALEWNPLGALGSGRVSFNAEWVPVTHNGIIVSPHFIHKSSDIATDSQTVSSQTFTGFGGELGYRYYTGRRGMNGVFVGPSVIAGVYNAALPDGDQAFTDLGLALDVGVHEILWNHLVLGAGAGVEYLHVSHDFHDLPGGPAQIASSGVKPRLLLEVGYGF